MSRLRLCRTFRSPFLPISVMVQRSPFLTQSVAVRRSRRSLRAGDDHVSDTGLVSVGQRHLGCRRRVIEAMRAGTAVEFGYEVPGGREHDRVEPSRSVGNPSVERILSSGGYVADMNTAVIKVELEPRRVTVAEGK